MATTNLVKTVAIKSDEGTLGSDYKLSSSFQDIIDNRQGKGNYTLAQFFDNYISFMRNGNFIYMGNTQPTNTHIAIWIDTSTNNQADLAID